ncbi:MAG: carbamoyltransferase [Candidatus Aureabacteria bacterium]|nr:carbamoyltransferase [Candidatus Auribacterota bacterium]
MNILGFSSFIDNSGAALIQNGRLVAAMEEEKFVRRRYTGEFPINAIQYCLEAGGIGIEDVDHVAFFFRPWLGIHRRLWEVVRYLPGSLHFYGTRGGQWMNLMKAAAHTRNVFHRMGAKPRFKFHYIEHHLAHAASAFFLSGFDEAAIFTIDGSGEIACGTLCKGEGNRITKLKQYNYPHSMGYLYASVTHHLGFRPARDEGKVMGLTSYGDPSVYEKEFDKIVLLGEGGDVRLDLDYFEYQRNGVGPHDPELNWVSDKFRKLFGPPRRAHDPIEKRHQQIAAGLQRALEKAGMHMVRHLHTLTGSKRICIAGGVALNSVLNGVILREGPFERMFIQPAAGDNGGGLGAASYLCHAVLGRPRVFTMDHAYTGPEYSDAEVEAALRKFGLHYTRSTDIARETAALIAEGRIVGWFQGRLEFGPRALGNRSIVVDPRRAEMKDTLNYRVKHREAFRPFAPSVLEERCGEYFDSAHPSPFMLLVHYVKPEKRSVIPAVTHVDGTGRVQTVSKRQNPLYYRLIEEFGKLTGVPVILNTSFNDKGEPIVCTPNDAISFFVKTQIDYLAIGPYLVKKEDRIDA